MPAYLNGPFNPPVTTLLRGRVAYSIGGFDDLGGQTKMLVTADAIASNVATLYLTIIEGDAPATGDTIYVQATANSSGAFNTSTGVVLTGATFTGTVGTVTFALTASDQAKTADVGIAVAPEPETTESVSTTTGKQFGMPQTSSGRSAGDVISWSYQFPGSAPGSVAIALQGADVDVDSQYTTIDSGTSTTGETRPPLSTSGLTGVNFLRVKITAMTGGPVATVAKITC